MPQVWQAQQTQGVQLGTVVAVRSVTIAATTTETAGGSAIGAALGGLLGHQVGNGKGRTLATVAGAVAGGLGGNLVGQHAYQQPGLEISVKLDGGNVVSVTQAADVDIAVGERVQLIAGNGCPHCYAAALRTFQPSFFAKSSARGW